MRTEFSKSHNTFGWNLPIHKKITRLALKEVPVLEPYKKSLVIGSTGREPFFRFWDFFDKRHCYYGTSKLGIGNTEQNALDVYRNRLLDSVIDWEFGDENLAMREIGEALHVLQDISDPLHTNLINKNIFKTDAHKIYDRLSRKSGILSQVTEIQKNSVTDNFYDLFGKVYEKSSKSPNPLDKQNLDKMPELVKEYLLDAYSATVAFLKRLGNFHIMSDAHKSEAISNEFSTSAFIQKIKQ